MSAPMSMEEWQRSLRAQKQQDRENKNKSAEILRSYQAKEEEEVQRKIRESRRESQMKKNEAKEFLATYRPDAATIDAISPTKASQQSRFDYDGPLPEIVSAPTKDDPRQAIAEGAVSSLAANFAGSSTHSNVGVSEHNTATSDRNNFSFTEIKSSEADSPQRSEVNQDWVQITSDECDIPGSEDTNSGGNNAAPENTQTNQQPTFDRDDAVEWTNQTQTASEQSPVSNNNRLDVNFSFGLISTRAQPSLDAYMRGVQDVLTEALDDNVEMQKMVSYNSNYPPYVKALNKDESFEDPDGRGNVQRLLVKAAVPTFTSDSITPKKARSFVIKTLSAALKEGYFLKIAEES